MAALNRHLTLLRSRKQQLLRTDDVVIIKKGGEGLLANEELLFAAHQSAADGWYNRDETLSKAMPCRLIEEIHFFPLSRWL